MPDICFDVVPGALQRGVYNDAGTPPPIADKFISADMTVSLMGVLRASTWLLGGSRMGKVYL